MNSRDKRIIILGVSCLVAVIVLSVALHFLAKSGGLFHRVSLVIKEPVMADSMRIIATNKNGAIEIRAVGAVGRQIKWDGKEVKINLWPRISRWYGSLGGYYPTEIKGMLVNMEEGQQHFCSVKELLQWIRLQKVMRERDDIVYRSDGLVIGWHFEKNPHPQQAGPLAFLSVSVWQCYVLGRKPDSLPGASDDAITLSCTKPECTEPPVGRFSPHKPKIINGRLYSGKALDLMGEMGISYEEVEKVIEKAEAQKEGEYHIFTSLDDPFNTLSVILNSSGEVIFITR